ncbi:MAG: hypothetical protein CMI16_11170 [Opitutaceae bacterium]|nr:hypothetical protein [Opitutaceae bacterium]
MKQINHSPRGTVARGWLIIGGIVGLSLLGLVLVSLPDLNVRNSAVAASDKEPVVATDHPDEFAPEESVSYLPKPNTEVVVKEGADQAIPVSEILPELTDALKDWRNFNPATLQVRLFGDTVVAFTRVSFTEKNGRTTWIGSSSIDGGWLVAVASELGWHAAVSFEQGNAYSIDLGKQGVIREANPDEIEFGPMVRPPEPVTKASSLENRETAEVNESTISADELPISPSDVAVFYDRDAETKAKAQIATTSSTQTAHDYLTNLFQATFEMANIYLIESDVQNLQWNILVVEKIPYYEVGGFTSMERELTMMDRGTEEAGAFMLASAKRNGADQLLLIVGGTRDYSGVAYTPGNEAVVYWYNDGVLPYVVAHELAHNFGCSHDRVTAKATDGDGRYSYGHAFTGGFNVGFGTILSYKGFRVGRFSNPDISYEGAATGVAETQPKAANNAKQLRLRAAAMSATRASSVAPVIITQPSGTTVNVGESFTLTVEASGGTLTYAWFKGGGALAGAVSSSYTKSSATTADSGAYTVVVNNGVGSITSASATVSVSAPSNPVTTTSVASTSSGGVGGGGGAPSIYTLVALAGLACLRILRQLQRGV